MLHIQDLTFETTTPAGADEIALSARIGEHNEPEGKGYEPMAYIEYDIVSDVATLTICDLPDYPAVVSSTDAEGRAELDQIFIGGRTAWGSFLAETADELQEEFYAQM